ncbi:uncharacterized protein H6S33_002550 [Morchella sextelata]|uniref:uncharacterized protein n=1 Tax=Morchella sextelata TaxID=1174677 RepID=UPI001D054753|nr:uncharacterized protein H6S33_002550 [Morchella sextelata]KAH0607516.1 hypothetical protein H6S33_002550 [Morchella sextelata]
MGEPSAAATAAAPIPLADEDEALSPLSLTIRFTNALPDTPLFVPSAATTTVSALKQQLRDTLPPDHARRRLRLIYAGKVLPDTATLASQIAAPRPPPASSGKGKERATDAADDARARPVYIHCSVGDVLTDEELAAEAANEKMTAPEPAVAPPRTTLPQPLGFDRLLSAGFSEADVASLRMQFNRLHGYSRDEEENARLLEDRWIDESAGQGQELADGSPAGSYEDMFVGMAIGFFWPVAIFLMREEGVFSKRRQMAVVAGLLVNLAFSVLRISS